MARYATGEKVIKCPGCHSYISQRELIEETHDPKQLLQRTYTCPNPACLAEYNFEYEGRMNGNCAITYPSDETFSFVNLTWDKFRVL